MKKFSIFFLTFLGVFGFVSTTFALAGFVEVQTTHRYNSELLIDWGKPSDLCSGVERQVCMIIPGLSRILEISSTSKDGKIIARVQAEDPWVFYDYRTKQVIQSGESIDEVINDWGDITMVDAFSVEEYFPETAQSYMTELSIGIGLMSVFLFFPLSLIFTICFVLSISAHIRYKKTKLSKWNTRRKISAMPVILIGLFYLGVMSLAVMPYEEALIFFGAPDERIILPKMEEYASNPKAHQSVQEDVTVSEPEQVAETEPEVIPNEEEQAQPQTNDVEQSNSRTYINERFGFSFEIPVVGPAQPIHIYEVENGIYVSTKPSLASILADSYTQTWYLQFATVSSEQELTEHLKERYQPGCEIESLLPTNQEGVYDVRLQWKGPDTPEEEGCFINYITVIKYYPKKNLVVTWDIGQDANFFNNDFTVVYDDEMTKSFRFLE